MTQGHDGEECIESTDASSVITYVNNSPSDIRAAMRVNRPKTSMTPIANSASATSMAIQLEFGTTKLWRNDPHQL